MKCYYWKKSGIKSSQKTVICYLNKLNINDYCIECYSEKLNNVNAEIQYIKEKNVIKKIIKPILIFIFNF